jgi:hypothetical protein
MLNSQSAIAAVRRHGTPEQASRVAARDRRDILPELTSAESSEANPAMAQADATRLSMFWLFLEGFAVYGASLPGFATTAVTAISARLVSGGPWNSPGANDGNRLCSFRLPHVPR